MDKRKDIFTLVLTLLLLGPPMAYWPGGMRPTKNNIFKTKARKTQQGPASYWEKASLYVLDKEGPSVHVKSDLWKNFSQKGIHELTNPTGHFLSNAGERTDFKGYYGKAWEFESKVFLSGKARLDRGNDWLMADEITYLVNKEHLFGVGNVNSFQKSPEKGDELIILSEKVEARPKADWVQYQGSVEGRLKKDLVYSPPVDFKTDLLTGLMGEGRIEMKGNVYIKRLKSEAWSRKGELFLEKPSNELKYFELNDDVKLKELVMGGDGRPFLRKGFGEKLLGLVREDKYILTGLPKVYQQGDLITGNKITLRDHSELVEVDDANTFFIVK